MRLKFGFVIFWQKDFGAKAAHKMLVKFTPSLILGGQGWEPTIGVESHKGKLEPLLQILDLDGSD
jgi:hypothetical protein